MEDGDRGREEEISTDEAQFSENSESMGRTKHSDVLERHKEQIAQLVTDAKFFREAGSLPISSTLIVDHVAGYDGESLLDELMQQCSFLPDEQAVKVVVILVVTLLQHSVRIALSGLLFSPNNEELQSHEKCEDE